jgi:hypothetical protein
MVIIDPEERQNIYTGKSTLGFLLAYPTQKAPIKKMNFFDGGLPEKRMVYDFFAVALAEASVFLGVVLAVAAGFFWVIVTGSQ